MRKIRKKSISLHKIQPKHPFFDVRDNHIHHRVGRRDWCPGVGPYGSDRHSRHPAYAQQGPTTRSPLGASLSDFFYAVVTVFFLGLVVDWLDQYESTLQFVGSLAIAAYAVYLWKSNPASSLQNKDTSADSLSPRLKTSGILKNFLSGFGITVSNPFIIFFFIALFARTNFLFAASTKNWWLYIVGFASLISGAVGWWFLITWVVNKVRNNFGVRTLRNINHGIALIMFGIALFGFGNGFYYLFINK